MDKEELKPVKKKSIFRYLDSFTYFFLGFLTICSVIITFGAYNKGENVFAIIFSFISGFLIATILSVDKEKELRE